MRPQNRESHRYWGLSYFPTRLFDKGEAEIVLIRLQEALNHEAIVVIRTDHLLLPEIESTCIRVTPQIPEVLHGDKASVIVIRTDAAYLCR